MNNDMHPIIKNNPGTIRELCRRYHVQELYVFGSVVRNDFGEESDVDFLLEYDYKAISIDPFENFLSLKRSLERLLNREVDLVEYSQLNNRYLKYFIDKEKQQLYA